MSRITADSALRPPVQNTQDDGGPHHVVGAAVVRGAAGSAVQREG
ncbi:MAG TPA: hypothetical protein VLJ40_05765 [Arthrobacter sp.]|nr:hypothetical protein [Arthrobacter sp.]